MAFRAIGRAVAKLPSGLLQVTVEYVADDAPEKVLITHHYIVADKQSLHAKVTAQLDALKMAQDEEQSEFNVVGEVLGVI
jgi:hypothetical protein